MTACIKVIAMIMAGLLSAAWLSPCCCQSAWLSDEGARLMAPAQGGGEHGGCCGSGKEEHRECCPLGAKECKSSFGKVLTARVVTEVAPTHEWMVWAWEAAGIWTAQAARTGPARVERSFFGPDATLLGLRCALTI